ncbi:CoA-transferase [Variovorax paradoxus]|nr:CaiB/BaiF CoA-transferase family protein [Xenophilus azovorans]KPU99574.1 CoA-transferase [Variovorax paradoxus]MBN8748626.1 CoA transferase [Variovorax sp.]VTY39626.1 Acetyl-CoA:oxalate CoA-transferase [Xylophilus ampelinus]KPV01960.1 CoA-transferase [Variovorax paradoxus]KPV02779.1 CoA-transferase [Variovorax paradoxus]
MLPLQGMLVVTLEHAIAAPFCTRQLADLGARVIKVERPGEGDFARAYDTRAKGSASHFVWCNRGKESLTLNLKHAASRAVLQELVERADVLVQNLAPGAAARMGLDHASLAPRNPKLVVCDISGYGDGGPFTEKKAYDLLIQSESGFVSVTGTPEQPSKAGLSIADIAAGMYAYSSVLAALLERGRTGRGKRLEISMLEAMSEWMGFPLYYTLDGQPPPPRAGASHAAIYPYGPFACGDGRKVVLAVQHDREWATFCDKVLHRPELAGQYKGNAKRLAERETLREVIEQVCAGLTGEQLVERLEDAQIAYGRLNEMADLWQHAQLRARARWTEIGTPGGPVPALYPPHHVAGEAPPPMGSVPALGAHTDAILAELGRSADEIARLRAERAV